MLDLGYRDKRMDDAFELVASKRRKNGRWALENSYNDKLLVPIEALGADSKWITFNALRALSRGYPSRNASTRSRR